MTYRQHLSISTLICLSGLSSNLHAQLLRPPPQVENPEAVWQQLMTTAEEARRHGDYGKAEAACLQAVDMVKQLPPPDTHLAQTQGQLGTVYLAQRNFDSAEKTFTDAIHSAETAVGPNHPMVAMALDSLAQCYFMQAKFQQAIPICQRIVGISEFGVNEQNKNLARSKQLLASAYFSAGQMDQAKAAMRESIDLIHRCGDADIEKQFRLIAGRQFEQMHDNAAAVEQYKSGLALATSTGDNDMAFQFEQAASDLFCAAGDYVMAEASAKQALQMREKENGPNASIDNKLNVAICEENLGKVYLAWKRPDQAVTEFAKAAEISEQNKGAETGELAHFLAHLAEAEQSAGQPQQAADHFERALPIAEKLSQPAELAAMHEKYAVVLTALNRSDEARKHLAQAKTLRESVMTQPTTRQATNG